MKDTQTRSDGVGNLSLEVEAEERDSSVLQSAFEGVTLIATALHSNPHLTLGQVENPIGNIHDLYRSIGRECDLEAQTEGDFRIWETVVSGARALALLWSYEEEHQALGFEIDGRRTKNYRVAEKHVSRSGRRLISLIKEESSAFLGLKRDHGAEQFMAEQIKSIGLGLTEEAEQIFPL